MKLLTFLGTGNYQPTSYVWGEKAYTTRFSPVAAYHFLQPGEIFLFLTKDAEPQGNELSQELPPQVLVHLKYIPLGKNESELWQIFSDVSDCVDPGDEIAFDVTHGLRHLPMLGLLAAAFLRAGFSVDLRAVLYGAFDVGRQVSPGQTPVFDLTPLLTLLEWAIAADRFNRTGDARYLSSLVGQRRKQMAEQAGGNHSLLEQVGRLNNLAGALTEISQALHLLRPDLAMSSVARLPDYIEKARPALVQSEGIEPFARLLDSIQTSYQPLAHPSPQQPETLRETLLAERRMVGWYIERELWVQAVSLAREWLLSWVMFQLGLTYLNRLENRQYVERTLGAEAEAFLNAKRNGQTHQSVFWRNLPELEQALSLWSSITKVRNDVDHAGKREDPADPKSLQENIKSLYEHLKNLPV
jgi:CRISPR-associated DxTHG motif protein